MSPDAIRAAIGIEETAIASARVEIVRRQVRASRLQEQLSRTEAGNPRGVLAAWIASQPPRNEHGNILRNGLGPGSGDK